MARSKLQAAAWYAAAWEIRPERSIRGCPARAAVPNLASSPTITTRTDTDCPVWRPTRYLQSTQLYFVRIAYIFYLQGYRTKYVGSDAMSLVQLFVPTEVAHDTVSELGELGNVQFKDVCAQYITGESAVAD